MKKITFLKLFGIFCMVLMISSPSFGQNMALDFDGTPGQGGKQISGQLVKTNIMIPFDKDFTIISFIEVKSADSQIFVWGCASINNFFALDIDAEYKLRVRVPAILGPGIVNEVTSNVALAAGFYKIAIVSENGVITLYLNGENVGTADLGAIIDTLSPTISSFGTGSFNGDWMGAGNFILQQFSIFNLPFTPEQITMLLPLVEYEAYLRGQITNSDTGTVIAAFDFESSQNINLSGDNQSSSRAAILKDKTGKYDGTLVGFPLTGNSGNWVAAPQEALSTNLVELGAGPKVYPNPATNVIKVSNLTGEKSFKIYNVLGAEVLSNKVNKDKEINVSSLVKGLYFMKLDKAQTVKFLKN